MEQVKGNLDKFLKGEPQTDDLAAMARGEEPTYTIAVDPQETGSRVRDLRELTDDDREHLRRLTLEPGWEVLLRLWNRSIEQYERAAQALSLDNPLGDKDKIAESWAYVAMLKRSQMTLRTAVKHEVDSLKKEKTQ